MELVLIFVIMFAFMWMMSRGAKKAQQAQIDQREEAIVVGTNVVTTSGFFGRIVDIDGDAITLESPSGDETVWLRSAIRGQMDIPLAWADEYDAETDGGDILESGVGAPEAKDSPLTNSSPFDDEEDNKGSAWK
ncbi:MAG: preprotein translocase subunit YajC [Actinomycetaceae bacterium]|nr:preprotein translocase subunit YajC [Actinomycetaceae bacterium]